MSAVWSGGPRSLTSAVWTGNGTGDGAIHEQREREAAGLTLVGQRGDGQVAPRASRATSASRPVWDCFETHAASVD